MDLSKVTEITPRIEKLLAAEEAGYKFIGTMSFQVEMEQKSEETNKHLITITAGEKELKIESVEFTLPDRFEGAKKEELSEEFIKPALERIISKGDLQVANIIAGELFSRKNGSFKFYYRVDFIVEQGVKASTVGINKYREVIAL